MNSVKKILIAIGFAVHAALAFQNIGLVDCGGLFLLHQQDKHFAAKYCSIKDSLTVRNFEVNGAFYHAAIQGRYTDKWHIKGLSRQNVGSAGFESHYKNVSLGVSVNTYPMVMSTISVHREDSLFGASANLARGSINIGNISWIPDEKTEMVGPISVDWETHVLFRQLAANSKIGNNYINLSLSQIKTTPHNPDKEHYIRDSANVIALSAKYDHVFEKSRLTASYTYANADITLYGIFHNEESRKRFMYMPLDAALHFGHFNWDWDALQTHLEYMHISGKLHSNPNRFFETLAPNRALSSSAIKGLSFAFLQKVFRVEANLDAFGFLGGINYRWNFGTQYKFIPKTGLDFFEASGDIDIHKRTETTKVLGTSNAYNESSKRKLNSFGSIISLGFEMSKKGRVEWSIDYGITQMIPFYIDYRDLNAKKSEDEKTSSGKNENDSGKGSNSSNKNSQKTDKDVSKNKSGSLERDASALLFRNGFATHLGVRVKF